MNGKFICKFIIIYLVYSAVLSSAYAESDEENVGNNAAAQILGVAKLHNNNNVQKYLNLVGANIAEQVGQKYKWRFAVIDTESVNAFATSSGIIFVTKGLFNLLQNEDELAFVLAHEISHVTKRHHYQVVLKQRLIEKASKNLKDIIPDNKELSQLSGQIYARGLDKTAEYEADRIGATLMTRAGYNPSAVLGVIEKLKKLNGDDPQAQLLFATHPSPSQREDELISAGLDKLPIPNKTSLNREKRFKELGKLK
ncbi:MAG: M48 family metalloprotease [Sphaerospermopsis sp.]|nr:M48 family metalloprotease [Sphaerospermopsis sp.]